MANDNLPGDTSGNRAVLISGVQALMGIWQALLSMGATTVGVSTVAALPVVASVPQGSRRMVTDANSTTFNSVVAGGGTNVVPVFSTGIAWRIG